MKFGDFLLIFVVICGVFGQLQGNNQECGMKFLARIVGGTSVNQAEWPWLVAFVNTFYERFFCSGSLVSTKHVVSGEKKYSIEVLTK